MQNKNDFNSAYVWHKIITVIRIALARSLLRLDVTKANKLNIKINELRVNNCILTRCSHTETVRRS